MDRKLPSHHRLLRSLALFSPSEDFISLLPKSFDLTPNKPEITCAGIGLTFQVEFDP
jgi:hypothetical protein